MTRTHASFLVPLLVLGLAAPLDTSAAPRGTPSAAAAPRQFPGAITDINLLDGNERLRRAHVDRSPEMTALVTSALRGYAEGTASRDPLGKAIAKSMNKTRGGKAIAKRILARIDALTADQRTAAFAGKSDRGSVSVEALGTTAAGAAGVFAGVGIKPPDTLPAVGLKPPNTLALELTGVKATEIADADGSDELLAMTTIVRIGGDKKFIVETTASPQSGALTGLAAGDIDPLDQSVYSGAGASTFVATAVFEVDGDDAAIREEFLAMAALAQPLAEQLATAADDTTTRLNRFAFALDYTIGLLAVSRPTTWPAGVLQKSVVDLGQLWATPPATAGAVPWKLAHVHDLPTGHYTVYFDVPAPANLQPNLKVKIVRVESLDPESGGDDLTLWAGIGDDGLNKTVAENKNVHNVNWTVQRKVNTQKIQITLGAYEHNPPKPYGYASGPQGIPVPCGDPPGPMSHAPCPATIRDLDVDPGSPLAEAKLWIEPTTGAITGAASGNVGDTLTITGDDEPRAKFKIVITID
jgi:hypothetical protein